MAEKKKKSKQWLRPHHRVVVAVIKPVFAPVIRWMYGIQTDPFKEQGNRNYLVLLNHQTPFDQFFVYMSFRGPLYFVATEDIFSKGWISSLIRWLANPIPIKKQTTDISAVMNCIRVAKEGGTIAIAPEGNRTYNGKTVYMNPAIAAMAKRMKLPIALYRIEGGYGVQPRWSDKIRKGKMRGYVSHVIEPEEYKDMTPEELMMEIQRGLDVDESQIEGIYRSKRKAEYMERVVYTCPYCGFSKFESQGNETECMTCHRKISYGEDKKLRGVGFDFPFTYMCEWYDHQEEFIHGMDPQDHVTAPVFTDKAALMEVILKKKKQLLRDNATYALYGDRITIDEGTEQETVIPFSEVTAMAVLGRNKLNIYHDQRVFQVKGDCRFNALKYVNFYHRFKNSTTGEENGKFLGL